MCPSAATPLLGDVRRRLPPIRESLREKAGAPSMQSSSRTIVSVVGTVLMVVTTVLLAAWSPPQTPVQPTANQVPIVGR
ncbi:hypothetical protein GCM10011581_11470 [Saccharopolyspora subtropica]|uniref:Uncharacterized protein n=1 Tax=Saccharopolyspora thermophila TaxID=89367 RepID=A0A917N8F7_9PSEU|nr:hypothetical protein GCM10011581_11470 [Saccharopolyspora subtropica]